MFGAPARAGGRRVSRHFWHLSACVLKSVNYSLDEDKIEEQVNALRTKLLANLSALAPSVKSLKASDTHGLARKQRRTELSKNGQGTLVTWPSNYSRKGVEAFDREKQEENKMKRLAERAEREQRKAEERSKMEAQKSKWEAEKREKGTVEETGGG